MDYYSARHLVRKHGQFQLDLKYAYPLSDKSDVKYKFAIYFFVPDTLNINRSTYTKSRFYRDIKEYVRLKTPIIDLREFRNPQSRNPLNEIKQITKSKKGVTAKNYSQDSRWLSRMLRSSLRDYSLMINMQLADNNIDEAKRNIAVFTKEARLIAADWRATRPWDDQEELLVWYRRVDESISLFIQQYAVQIISVAEKYDGLTPLLKDLRDCTLAEIDYRKKMKYKTVPQEGSDNEAFMTRASQLKKYSSSILYLNMKTRPEGKKIEQFYFAVAAGLSMVVATLIAFYYQQQYGQFTLPFFMALVIGYMLKDRIKEFSKFIVTLQLGRRLYDRRTYLTTKDHNVKIGYVREKFRFVTKQQLPTGVLMQRRSILKNPGDTPRERVMRYTKEFVLHHNDPHKGIKGPELTSINDIMRFDVRPYLKKMNDPTRTIQSLDDKGRLKSFDAHRVYPINIVITLRGDDEQEQVCQHITLVLDQEGICRIDNILSL